jgi:hypothetical protein
MASSQELKIPAGIGLILVIEYVAVEKGDPRPVRGLGLLLG